MADARAHDTGGSADVEEIAEKALAEMTALHSLRGVGYYTRDECKTTYLRADVPRRVDDRSRLLEDAVYESIGVKALEAELDDDVTSTIRVFEKKVVLYCHVGDHEGVVVSLDHDPLVDYRVLQTKLEGLAE